MTVLQWDKPGDKVFEAGIDKGVLYLEGGLAVPWNGLTSVTESTNNNSSPTYYDGRKISDLVDLGDFTANLKAFTYPPEFLEIEGLGKFQDGVYLGEQRPKSFSLSYRSRIGNDLNQDAGYKIHILYNLIAIPKDKTYETISGSIQADEFEWDISSIPEEIEGFAPSAHITLNTIDIDSTILENIEEILYGTSEEDASLIPLGELLTLIGYPTLLAIKIIDNGDGTWTATSVDDSLITITDDTFVITDVNSIDLDSNTYRISSSLA